MKKHRLKVMSVGIVCAVAVTSFSVPEGMPLMGQRTVQAVKSMDEKPLAGITISLDHYCDALVQVRAEAAREAQMQEQEVAAEVAQVEAGAVEQSTTVEQQVEGESETAEEPLSTQEAEAESEEEQEEEKKKEEKIRLNIKYDKLGIANVQNYLNVRAKPSEDAKIVGKMTKHSGCNILAQKGDWSKIESGKVTGYVMSKYLLEGETAEKVALKVARLRATVKTQTLNVRYLPSTEAHIYDQFSEDEAYTVEKENLTEEYMKTYIAKHCSKRDTKGVDLKSMYEDVKNWAMLSVDDEKVFVSKDFISMKYTLNRAVTIQEEQKKQESQASQTSTNSRAGIVEYAMQFLGNPYVWGGTSLTNGTDCSGFTQGIYRHFGIYIPRTSAAQAAALPSVSSSDVQVGDLFFYGSGTVSHVALYIGNGQIIHASNHRDGIKISSAYYRKPLKIGRPS